MIVVDCRRVPADVHGVCEERGTRHCPEGRRQIRRLRRPDQGPRTLGTSPLHIYMFLICYIFGLFFPTEQRGGSGAFETKTDGTAMSGDHVVSSSLYSFLLFMTTE